MGKREFYEVLIIDDFETIYLVKISENGVNEK